MSEDLSEHPGRKGRRRAWHLVPRPHPGRQEGHPQRLRGRRHGGPGDRHRHAQGPPGLVQEDGPRVPRRDRRARLHAALRQEDEVMMAETAGTRGPGVRAPHPGASTNNISDPGIDLAGQLAHALLAERHGDQRALHERHQAELGALRHAAGLRRRLHRRRRRRVRLPVRLQRAHLADHGRRADAAHGQRLRAAAPAHGGHLLGLRRALHQLHARVLRVPDQAGPSRKASAA